MNSKIQEKIEKLKKMNLSGKIDWEIDYSELNYYLKDEHGKNIKPFLFIIAHLESYFVIKAHLTSPSGDYLLEFLYEFLDSLEKADFYPKKILVKKNDLYNLFADVLKDLNINLSLVKRTPAVEYFKRESGQLFK